MEVYLVQQAACCQKSKPWAPVLSCHCLALFTVRKNGHLDVWETEQGTLFCFPVQCTQASEKGDVFVVDPYFYHYEGCQCASGQTASYTLVQGIVQFMSCSANQEVGPQYHA